MLPNENMQGVEQPVVSEAQDVMLAQIADTALSVDHGKLNSLGSKLYSKWERFEKERRPLEIKWLRNLRQFLGEYDPEIKNLLDPNRSQAYPRLTRVKCISMLSRIMNLMFPATDKNWSVEPSKVPNLPPPVVQTVINRVLQQSAETGQTPDSAQIESAIYDEARTRARRMEREISDQLEEIGGSTLMDYPNIARAALLSGILYGVGVTKGPATIMRKKRTWMATPTGYVPNEMDVIRPLLEPVNVWYWYPDMTAQSLHRQDATFERLIYTRNELRSLSKREGFFTNIIDEYLRQYSQGNYKRRTFEQELRTMGASINTTDADGTRYEIIAYYGYISAHDLAEAGVPVPESLLGGDVFAEVWMLDNKVIRALVSPWYEISDRLVPTFHYFEFERDDTSVVGNALPNIMRDSQLAMAAAARMLIDNASVTSGPQLELNTDLLRPDQDMSSVHSYKIWYRDGMGADAQYPAIREIKINSHIEELTKIIDLFRDFADQETFINPMTGGDMQRGPSEPFRTAAGASMLRGDMALPFKDVVRNFDKWTQSIIGALVEFNKVFSTDNMLHGDYEAVARGVSSLVAKEVRGVALDQFAMTLDEDDKLWLDRKEFLIERAQTRDIPIDQIMVSENVYKQRVAQRQQEQERQQAQQQQLIEATVRKVLADALKSVTQAEKNTSAARVNEVNVALDALSQAAQVSQTGGGNAKGTPETGTSGEGSPVA